MEQGAVWVAEADRIAVLTGAGISTESGIPDYRGPNGVWTTNPSSLRMMQIDVYLADPEIRRQAWLERMNHPAWSAQPNAGHAALADLERTGRLEALITQNIDGLHRAAGSREVLELHGSILRCRCLECGFETPMQQQLDRVRAGESDPACERCSGIQRSATVAFGQQLDPGVLLPAFRAADACDLFLAVGTSLTVQPAAQLCQVAKRSGARLVIVNAEPTPYDEIADRVISAPIGESLPQLLGTEC
ncbi:MAG: Sir2 family NAD-dependent protein deacetylase [Actinomycetota bacterium]